MKKQRIIGILLIVMSLAIILLASTGTTPEEQDVTAVLLILPLGIYALVTKKYILNIPMEPEKRREKKAISETAISADGKTRWY